MSQFFLGVTAGSLPPTVPTTFQAQNGTPPVNDGTAQPSGNTINFVATASTENNANGFVVSASGSTITYTLTNRIPGSGTTVGATTSDLFTFPLSAVGRTVYRFVIEIAGIDSVTGDGIGYSITSSANSVGGVAAVISVPDISFDPNSALAAGIMSFVASGNSVILRATGVAGRIITYNALANYIQVS